jgi:DNA-binding NtrC family response regulator
MSDKMRVVVVDDDENILLVFRGICNKLGYELKEFSSPLIAYEYLKTNEADLCIFDINMPEMDGIELMRRLKGILKDTVFIIMSGVATVENAVSAMKEGAYDLIQKPFSSLEYLISVMDRALEKRRLVKEIDRLRLQLSQESGFCGIIGRSPAILKVFDIIQTVASSTSSILITGESGTGKELVARAIHSLGNRKDRPFVPINCSAITETLFESELFGHIRGSFTNAFDNKKGLLEVASGGTVFLDEVGDIPLSIQVKLLRAIQEKEIRRIGSTENIKIDVRFISATNRDLKRLISEGKFREDLYYRLNVIEIDMPPLRERDGDIVILAHYFLNRYVRAMNKEIKGFSPDALVALENYPWPGNIRELENAIERAVVMCRSEEIQVCDLPENITRRITSKDIPLFDEDDSYIDAKRKIIESFERNYFIRLLERCNGNLSKAAEIAKMDRSNLRKLLKKYPDVYNRFK